MIRFWWKNSYFFFFNKLHPIKAESSILVVEGTDTDINEAQSLNEYFPIDSILFSNDIFVNDIHPSKAEVPMDFKDEGNIIVDKEEQCLKLYNPIFLTVDGRLISFKDVQSKKEWFSIVVNCEGFSNKTFSNDEHPLKESQPMKVTKEGIIICFNDLQSLKHDSLIEVREDLFS